MIVIALISYACFIIVIDLFLFLSYPIIHAYEAIKKIITPNNDLWTFTNASAYIYVSTTNRAC